MEKLFINVGCGSVVSVDRITSIGNPDSAPIKRVMAEYRRTGHLADYTRGRKVRSLIILDDGTAVASGMLPETLATRFVGRAGKKDA